MPPKNTDTIDLPGAELSAGDTLGCYQLLDAVGQGGMGRVWVARQVGSGLERLVAIKTALGGQGQSLEFEKLFMDEARIATMINHPNVCGVYELGDQGGTWFLVMEWCDGASLRELMDGVPGGRVDLAVACRIVANVAAGLHAAHELEDSKGARLEVVHRDVSPQNILISRNGHVKVTDFGVARARGQYHRPTETGEMKGKLAYMAPEQVTGKNVDRRADVFALGCVLYEMTVGKRPFHGEGALSTLYQLLEQKVVPPTEEVEGYPQALSNLILKALSKAPDGRFETAEQLKVQLEEWLAVSEQTATELDVAQWLTRSCGTAISRKSQRLRNALEHFSQPHAEGRSTAGESPDSEPSVTRREVPARVGSSTVDRGLSAGRLPEPSSSWLVPVGAVAVVLAMTVVLVRGSLGGVVQRLTGQVVPAVAGSPAVSAPVASSAPVVSQTASVEQTPPEPEKVRVVIRTSPPGAQLRIDDGPPLTAPFAIETVPSDKPHSIRASAPGRIEQRQMVAFDGAKEVVLSMPRQLPEPKKSRKRRAVRRAVSVQKVVPPAGENAKRSAEPRPPSHLPRAAVVKAKKPRGLDVDNPFALD